MRIILLLLFCVRAVPQVFFIELGAGSHNLFTGISYYYNNIQFHENLWVGINFRFRAYLYSLGPKKAFLELLLSPKLSYIFGVPNNYYNNYFLPEWNLRRTNEVFVKYNFFLDTRKTSQTTATIAIKIYNFALALDNDVFAFTAEDKFRTGSFGLFWIDSLQYVAVKYLSFTGDPRPAPTFKPSDKYPREYKDLSNAPYGKYSNGIVCVEFSGKFIQFPYVRVGLDYEKFRHFFQNKLIHDAPVIRKNNVHYPMLDINGNPYLSKEQILKPPKLHYEMGTNSYLFY